MNKFWIPAFVVPFVAFVLWFLSRFTGTRKKVATIMAAWVFAAVAAVEMVVWQWLRSPGGQWEYKSLVQAAIAGAVFLVCSSLSVWSYLRFRKSAGTS